MRLTKHGHACVEVSGDRGAVLLDPGAFTPNAAELVARNTAVLITHEHFDHVDFGVIDAALESRSELEIWAPASVIARWHERYPNRAHAVLAGDEFVAGGMRVNVYGGSHAPIHADIDSIVNVGYLIEDRVYHPGDSYDIPDVAVSTLLLPISGPWTKVGEAADFIRAIAPRRVVQMHEVMLSDVGLRSVAMFLSPQMLSPVPLTQLADGQSIEI